MLSVKPRRQAGSVFVALASYALLAVLFVWPLPAVISNHITGDAAGDAAAYVWNAYSFSYNLSTGAPLFATDRILSFSPEASLALHNNSLFLSALAAPFIPSLGVVASFNLALIVVLALNPFCAYLLARHETKAEGPSWIAGALFGFSPFISARVEGHMSLATAFALPLILLASRRAMASGSWSSWALVGLALALSAASDPYYLVFGVLAVGLVWSYERIGILPLEAAGLRGLKRAALLVSVLSLLVVVGIVFTGGGRLSIGPLQIGIRGLHTPVLVLTLGLCMLLFAWRPLKFKVQPGAFRSLKSPVFAGLVAAALLFPWLKVAVVEVLEKGGTEAPLWRSSPQGVDLLSFFMPNPTHPLVRGVLEPWMARERADAFVEGVASLTVSAIVIALGLALLRQGRAPTFWILATAIFAALALGPFLVVGGVDTHVPGPWALLRYVPGIGMVRSPTRFAVMAMLGFSMVVAHALASAKLGRHKTAALAGLALLIGAEELAPGRRIFPAHLPERYRIVAEDRCDVAVLTLPTGIKDGTRERGRFNSEVQFRQTLHGKRLVGGYLSRIDDDVIAAYEGHPTLRALFDLSEGKHLSDLETQIAVRQAKGLSRKLGLGFISVDKSEASQELRDFVHRAFEPRTIYKAGSFAISIPFGDSCAKGECGHAPGCRHRLVPRPAVE